MTDNWIAGAADALVGGAVEPMKPFKISPRRKTPKLGGHRNSDDQSRIAAQTKSAAGQSDPGIQFLNANCGPTSSGGQRSAVNQRVDASAGLPTSAGGRLTTDNHPSCAAPGDPLPQIVEQWRRRNDMLRARQRLELQAQAVCRRVSDGDKVAGGKLWLAVKADPEHPLRGWLNPFLMAIAPLDSAKREIEKSLVKLVRHVPVYSWAKGVSGFGDISLSGVIGECIAPVGEYKSVSAVWKRMGLAVINGGRQRRVVGAEALEHGYVAQRRSLMWNIGCCLIKAQVRKGEEDERHAIGEFGQVYLDRKVYLNERNASLDEAWTVAHIHNDAQRYMEKRLLRELWKAWRRAWDASETTIPMPAVEIRRAA